MRGVITWDEITCTAGATKTVAQLVAGSYNQLRITEMAVTFQGTDNLAKPVKIEVCRQSDAGTMSAATLKKMNDSDGDTLASTGQVDATAEPTTGDILRTWYIHPQAGLHYSVPEPSQFIVGQGDRIAVKVTIESGESNVDCAGFIEFEE